MPAASKHRGLWRAYERRGHPLLPMSAFLRRVAFNLCLGIAFIVFSLGLGMAGYHYFERLDLDDSFLNASMILSGMGPVDAMHSVAGKRFAGLYALYSGIAFLAVAGLVFAPLLHRLLHHFHADEKDLNPDEDKEPARK